MSHNPFSEEFIGKLTDFLDVCKKEPSIIHVPQLAVFKEYLTSLGVNIPAAGGGTKSKYAASADSSNTPAPPAEESPSSDESEESDVELDMAGVIMPDPPGHQNMGDPSHAEISDEAMDKSDELRLEAMAAFTQQNLDEAIDLYTKAIELNPQGALLFTKRGQVFLKQNKPNACIKDCSRALELNCDSAAAYKFRGRAYRLLGHFEEAANDLAESLKIDYDDQVNEWFQEVKPNAEKLRQHRLGQQRKKEAKEHVDRVKRARKAAEARARAAEAQAKAKAQPQARTVPPGFKKCDFNKLLADPEIMTAFQDPEVAAAFRDVSMNPANFAKYQSNPKIAAVIEKLQGTFGGEQDPADFPDGVKFSPGSEPPNWPKGDDDVGLD